MYNTINDFQIATNFNLQEFESPDTHTTKISTQLIQRLQAMRKALKHPIIITSGYRTPEHNKKVKGSPNSKHMQGIAVDISTTGHSLKRLIFFAIKFGFFGIISYPDRNCLHLDLRPIPLLVVPQRWIHFYVDSIGTRSYRIFSQEVFFNKPKKSSTTKKTGKKGIPKHPTKT